MASQKKVMKQDGEPGEAPFGSGDTHQVCREYEIRNEHGRLIGTLRTVVLRSEVKKPLVDRWAFASLQGLDERYF